MVRLLGHPQMLVYSITTILLWVSTPFHGPVCCYFSLGCLNSPHCYRIRDYFPLLMLMVGNVGEDKAALPPNHSWSYKPLRFVGGGCGTLG